ncbi:MAG TPA: hypothetical protein VKV39_00995 [Candidatus Sulfotelmatobacter sp.]|nr:hypothetical protein [Candidatus Sulfotelmatobacter sp.]
MADDPNKRQNEGTGSGGQGGTQQERHPNDPSQKRPSEPGQNKSDDEQNQGGQRRAS